MNSISMRESNRLLRESNPRRSFGDGSQQKFAVCSSRLLEQFSRLIEAYMENEIAELKSKIKSSEYDCAELVKENALLLERTKKLAQRQPSWPKGYRPHHRRPGSVMLKEKVIGRRS